MAALGFGNTHSPILISQMRPGGKRKRPKLMEDKTECSDLQDPRPLKRISPFLNTPKQRKEEKRQVLRLSYDKLRRIDDPEKCLLRSVLVHNTTKRLQVELMQEGGYWTQSHFVAAPVARSPSNHFLTRPGHLSCEYEVLNNSYLHTAPSLSATEQEVDDIACDELSMVLEHSMSHADGEPIKRAPLPSVQSHHTQTPRKTLNNSGVSSVWDYRAYAANLTGAPIFTGSITMGTPVNKDQLKSPSNPMATPVAMETDANKDSPNVNSSSNLDSSSTAECSDLDNVSTSNKQPSLPKTLCKDDSELSASAKDLSPPDVSNSCQDSKDHCQESQRKESKPSRTDHARSGYSYCECKNSSSCCCQRLVTSATTLASISQELDSFMTDYLSRASLEPSCSLSCAYLSGETDAKKSASASEGIESVLNSLVPVCGGM